MNICIFSDGRDVFLSLWTTTGGKGKIFSMLCMSLVKKWAIFSMRHTLIFFQGNRCHASSAKGKFAASRVCEGGGMAVRLWHHDGRQTPWGGITRRRDDAGAPCSTGGQRAAIRQEAMSALGADRKARGVFPRRGERARRGNAMCATAWPGGSLSRRTGKRPRRSPEERERRFRSTA